MKLFKKGSNQDRMLVIWPYLSYSYLGLFLAFSIHYHFSLPKFDLHFPLKIYFDCPLHLRQPENLKLMIASRRSPHPHIAF